MQFKHNFFTCVLLPNWRFVFQRDCFSGFYGEQKEDHNFRKGKTKSRSSCAALFVDWLTGPRDWCLGQGRSIYNTPSFRVRRLPDAMPNQPHPLSTRDTQCAPFETFYLSTPHFCLTSSSPWYGTRLSHGSVLLLEPLAQPLGAFQELVDAAHHAAFFL